jgi:hypothetical protein
MPFTVEVHHHILPDFFSRETNDAQNPVGGTAPPPWDADLILSYMDETGIDVAVTSISTPGVHVGKRRAGKVARAPLQRTLGEAVADTSEPTERLCRPAATGRRWCAGGTGLRARHAQAGRRGAVLELKRSLPRRRPLRACL